MSRGNEMGMDFEYQNQTGPLDARSPFAQLSANPQRFGTPSNKRHSPAKQHNTSLFQQSSPTKPLPPVPAWNTLYNTPRKMNSINDIDDSSAGETPKNESEANTPETSNNNNNNSRDANMGLRTALSRYDPSANAGAERTSPTKERERERPKPDRRESLWGKIKTKMYSPGRGEIARPEHSGAIEKRVKKRRERDLQRHVSRRRRHSMSDSGDDSEMARKGSRKVSSSRTDNERRPGWLSSFFTFIAQHPTVPHILSFYAQLAFNMFLLAGCMYLIYSFWSAVQGDVDKKSHEAMADIMSEMAECARQYTTNNCDPAIRLPALETVCRGWKRCMEQDASKVGRAKVSAHTFAEIFNSFVEPISWKAMAFTFLMVFGCFATTNFAFGFFRDRSSAQHVPQPYYPPPPPTPQQQRSFSGEGINFYGTPWQQQQHQNLVLEPGPSGFAGIEGRGSPVRRLQY